MNGVRREGVVLRVRSEGGRWRDKEEEGGEGSGMGRIWVDKDEEGVLKSLRRFMNR